VEWLRRQNGEEDPGEGEAEREGALSDDEQAAKMEGAERSAAAKKKAKKQRQRAAKNRAKELELEQHQERQEQQEQQEQHAKHARHAKHPKQEQPSRLEQQAKQEQQATQERQVKPQQAKPQQAKQQQATQQQATQQQQQATQQQQQKQSPGPSGATARRQRGIEVPPAVAMALYAPGATRAQKSLARLARQAEARAEAVQRDPIGSATELLADGAEARLRGVVAEQQAAGATWQTAGKAVGGGTESMTVPTARRETSRLAKWSPMPAPEALSEASASRLAAWSGGAGTGAAAGRESRGRAQLSELAGCDVGRVD
jgi:hypothetical protein